MSNIPLGMTFSAKGEKTIINALNNIERATSKVNTKTIAMGSAMGNIGANAIIGATKKVFQFGKEIIATGNEWYELRQKGEETFTGVSDSALIAAKYVSDSFLEAKNKTIAWFLEMLPDAIFVFQSLANEAQSSAKQIGVYFGETFRQLDDGFKAWKEVARQGWAKETYDISFIWDKDKTFNDYILGLDNSREPPENKNMFKDVSVYDTEASRKAEMAKIEAERIARKAEIQNKFNDLSNGKIEVNPEEKKKKTEREKETQFAGAYKAGSVEAQSVLAKILGGGNNKQEKLAREQLNVQKEIAKNTGKTIASATTFQIVNFA